MTEPSYPVVCRFCQEQLYGPVKYCPFCGKHIEPVSDQKNDLSVPKRKDEDSRIELNPEMEDINEQSDTKQEPIDSNEKVIPKNFEDSKSKEQAPIDQEPTPLQSQPIYSSEKPDSKTGPEKSKSEPSNEGDISPSDHKSKPGKGKWVFLAVAITIGVLGYFFIKKAPPPPPPPPPVTCEDERAMALEALHQGVQLSLTINMIAKQENVLNAAKKLVGISDRYKSQQVDAQNKLNESLGSKDKKMTLYREKLTQLSRYNPEQVFCAIQLIQKGNMSSRETVIMKLLTQHMKSLNNGGKPEQNKWISDFTKNFSNFTD